MSSPGRPLHLVRRFFATLRARPLPPPDQARAAAPLNRAERELFFQQPPADQRHGVDGARSLGVAAVGKRHLVAAALLHDVAKRHARLGILGRSLASACALVRIPLRGRWAAYLDHGAAAAVELEGAGSHPLVVTFARRHHGRRRPGTIPPDDWAALQAADEA